MVSVIFVAGTRVEQHFNMSVFIGGIKGEDQSVMQSQNPQLSGDTHNRTRLLSCATVSYILS